jgi:NAD(P)-dependent dehydrogenase (short-subunit alcohol dehydrogenase family)
MRLHDRVAIVTGGGSGIGLAITRRFIDEGAHVVAADRCEEHLVQFYEMPRVTPVQADIAVQADVDRLLGAVKSFGRLDIVCNNAGIVDRLLPVGEMTDEVWERVLGVNLTGPMRVSRAAIPLMLHAGHGVIINIASIGGIAGARAGAAYTASKHGLIGLTLNIAATYGRDGIRSVAIAPGGVDTGISLGGEPSERGFAARSTAPWPRICE